MGYEDLKNAEAERDAKEAAKEAKKAEREAKKAEKEAKKAAKEAEEAATGKKTRGRKRKSATTEADTPEPMVKVARISETLAVEGEQEAGIPERNIPLEWVCERQVEEDEVAPEPWRAPVARMY